MAVARAALEAYGDAATDRPDSALQATLVPLHGATS